MTEWQTCFFRAIDRSTSSGLTENIEVTRFEFEQIERLAPIMSWNLTRGTDAIYSGVGWSVAVRPILRWHRDAHDARADSTRHGGIVQHYYGDKKPGLTSCWHATKKANMLEGSGWNVSYEGPCDPVKNFSSRVLDARMQGLREIYVSPMTYCWLSDVDNLEIVEKKDGLSEIAVNSLKISVVRLEVLGEHFVYRLSDDDCRGSTFYALDRAARCYEEDIVLRPYSSVDLERTNKWLGRVRSDRLVVGAPL